MKKLFLICVLLISCAPGLTLKDQFLPTDEPQTDSSQNSASQSPNGDIAESSETTNPSPTNLVAPDFLVINEILYDAPGDEQDGNTFIELYGTPLTNLDGFTIQIMDGTTQKSTKTIQLNEKNTLGDQGLFVICDASTGTPTSSHVANCDLITNFDLQNGPDGLLVLNQKGEITDQLCYGFDSSDTLSNNFCDGYSAPDTEAGISLTRNDINNFSLNMQPSPGNFSVQKLIDETINPVDQNSSSTSVDQNFSAQNSKTGKTIVISEVITDPQQDWNDSSGGNGVPFDAISGNGTIGSTDEWIELKNVSANKVDLTNWTVNFQDGSDETYVFGDTTDKILFSGGGTVDLFHEQESLVITDPPGDMKNEITIELFDDEQNLVDSVSIDDGNATSVDDEANIIDLDGNISKNSATILF